MPLDLRAMVACEVVCVLAWAITGVGYALVAALVAGLGMVLAAVAPEEPPTRPRRRVRWPPREDLSGPAGNV